VEKLKKKNSHNLIDYLPKVRFTDIHNLLPKFISERIVLIKKALVGSTIYGFFEEQRIQMN
jgi:hypothetical protein